uniref:Secreted protein n=1 Tax=Strongyloides papillosus TaxID=174720 RepID=A0A0N5B3J7_STREA
MNSLSIVILIATFISASQGFLTNCNKSVSLPCTLLMTPFEDAYQNVFLNVLDPILKFVFHVGLSPNETKPEEIEAENVRIQTLVGSGTIVR